MKCVIFCGGKGTRLIEQTEFIPKALVPVGEHPILWHVMKIYSTYNINEFILPLGYKGDLIKRYFMEYKWIDNDFSLELKTQKIHTYNSNDVEDWNIHFVGTGEDTLTARRLFLVKKKLQGEEDFALTYCDGVCSVDIQELIAFHKHHGKIMTILGARPRSKYGQISFDQNYLIKEFQEKPVLKDMINGGFMIVNKKIFDIIDDKNMMIEEVMQSLARIKEIMVYPFDGFWFAMDTYKDYQDLNAIWKTTAPWKKW